MSFSEDGKEVTFLIPTIVIDDEGFLLKVSDEEAKRLFIAGKNPAVGKFDSVAEADKAAGKRSAAGGRFGNK